MFNSAVLDVVVGLIFGFLAISLATGAIIEAINSALKLRSVSLLFGIKELLNDNAFAGLAAALYQHAAINPRGPGAFGPAGRPVNWPTTLRWVLFAKQRPPAYIDPKQFASAFLDVTGLSAASVTAAPADAVAALTTALNTAVPATGNPQINAFLTGVVQRANGDLEKIRTEIGAWFDNGMDRMSGAFKRWTQLASFVIALALSILINVDSIRIARGLWEQPTIAERLKLPANVQNAIGNGGGTQAPTDITPAAPANGASGETSPSRDAATAQAAIDVLNSNLPAGWPSHQGENWWTMLGGWLITAIATLFGAPFWFDALQTVTRLKGSGPSPKEKTTGGAASA